MRIIHFSRSKLYSINNRYLPTDKPYVFFSLQKYSDVQVCRWYVTTTNILRNIILRRTVSKQSTCLNNLHTVFRQFDLRNGISNSIIWEARTEKIENIKPVSTLLIVNVKYLMNRNISFLLLNYVEVFQDNG